MTRNCTQTFLVRYSVKDPANLLCSFCRLVDRVRRVEAVEGHHTEVESAHKLLRHRPSRLDLRQKLWLGILARSVRDSTCSTSLVAIIEVTISGEKCWPMIIDASVQMQSSQRQLKTPFGESFGVFKMTKNVFTFTYSTDCLGLSFCYEFTEVRSGYSIHYGQPKWHWSRTEEGGTSTLNSEN